MKPRVVLITGCSSGFGRRMVTKFLEDGWMVYATLRRAEDRRILFEDELKRYADRLSIGELDVTSAPDRRAMADVVRQKGLGLDCVVNNAGYMLLGALEDASEDQMRRQFDVNFFGSALLIQELLPYVRESKGTIINVSSVFGFATWPLTSVYCASKYALEGLSESLYQELKPYGVRVTLLEPGSHRTALMENLQWGNRLQGTSSVYQNETVRYRQFREKLRAQSLIEADDVAAAAVRVARKKFPPLRVQVGRGSAIIYRLTRLFPELIGVRLMGYIAKRAVKYAQGK